MKLELSSKPDKIIEEYGFSWLEHVLAIPSPLIIVTSYKSNGMANATMQSWCTFVGEDGYHVILGSVNKQNHMYQSIIETKHCVVNLMGKDTFLKCMDTIKNNDFECDEIKVSGLTSVPASKVNAPLIEECMVNLECELAWEHDLIEGTKRAVLCLKVVNVWMDERLFDENIGGRYGDNGYLYNIHSPKNPTTGEEFDTYVGGIKKISTYEDL